MSEVAIQPAKSEPPGRSSRRMSRGLSSAEGVIFNYQTIETSSIKATGLVKLEEFMNQKLIAWSLTALIIIYSVLVVIRIAFESEISDYSNQLDILELIFLSFFVIEVIVRIIIYKLVIYKQIYFKYIWNLFDLIIITVCLIVIIGSLAQSSITDSKAFQLGKVLRIFRLFLMFRKMNIIRKYKDKIIKKKSAVVNLSSPSEKVIEILGNVLDMEWMSYHSLLKSELEWCIYMIKEQKIYQTNVSAVKEELRDLVNWAVNQNDFEEPQSPAKTDPFMKIVTLEHYGIDVESALAESHNWDFDIFKFEKLAESRALEIFSSHLFSLYNLYQSQLIDNERFRNFIIAIQSGYVSSNPYHNSTHAADVVQSFYYLLSTCQGIQICNFSDAEIAISIISAAIHDYNHPGFNNLFLINSSHNIALTYNDKSVLENYHVSSSFKLLCEDKNNFLDKVSKEERKKYRYKIIALVLSTDFARHFADLGRFQLKFSSGGVREEDDRLQVLEMMMHTSDVGNPSRPWKICYEWATKVMNEFFAQGDKERELGLPISNLCDKYTVNIPKSQIGFIELFIEPTYHMLEMVIPAVSENIRIIAENKQYWRELIDSKIN